MRLIGGMKKRHRGGRFGASHSDHEQATVTVLLTPPAEDYLEHLYMREVEDDPVNMPAQDDRVLGELLRHGMLRFDDDAYTMTPFGREQAAMAVRRHRLAERMLHDIINIHGRRVDEAACEFEHSLHHGIDEHICTLLGHPKTCPHGRPIPPGRCCREGKETSSPVIVSLAEMKPDECGTIAYLSTREPDAMQKLMALGTLPGSPVQVIQTFPSVVYQVGQTQIALDDSLAKDIYVRRAG